MFCDILTFFKLAAVFFNVQIENVYSNRNNLRNCLHDDVVDNEGYNLEGMKEKQWDFVCFHARSTKVPVFLNGYVAEFRSETINQ